MEKRGAASSVLALKLTKEFRFLYNRFNLIPRASRPFRRGCERRKNIYFRGIRLSRVTACPCFFLFFLLYTLSFILQFGSLLVSPLLLLAYSLLMRITAKKVFFDIDDATHSGTHNYFDCRKNSLSYIFTITITLFMIFSFFSFFYAGIIHIRVYFDRVSRVTCECRRTLKCQNHGLEYLATTLRARCCEVYSS